MAQTLEDEVAELEAEEGGGKRRLLLLGIAVVALLAVAAGGYLLLGSDGEEDLAEAEPEEGAVVEIPDLTANLAGEEMRYARLSMAAVLRAEVDVPAVEQRFPLLRDAALTELAAMTPEELRTAEGLAALKERMTAHARESYPDDEVLRILVTELVVQ